MPNLNRPSINLLIEMLDGEWHSTRYLAILAGKYVRPEVAWRKANYKNRKRSMDDGRSLYIRSILQGWLKINRVERRHNENNHGREIAEWRLIPGKWVPDFIRKYAQEEEK